MVLGLLYGFVFVALVVGTKLHVSLLNVKLVGFLFFVQERHFSVFCLFCFFFPPSEILLAASLLLDLILT